MNLFILIIFISVIFFQVSCTDKSSGTLSVSVVDNDPGETPIPDVEITITPGNIVKMTDANGLCSFELNPGDYYVDANVCCAGPTNIYFHELAKISANETKEVKLVGCLMCQ